MAKRLMNMQTVGGNGRRRYRQMQMLLTMRMVSIAVLTKWEMYGF